MAKVRIGIATFFELENQLVGIGTDNPNNTLQALGEIKSSDARTVGVTTLSEYQGFLDSKARLGKQITDISSKIGSQSGEIIIDGSVTVSSGTTFTNGPESLTVSNNFTLPGISDDKPTVGTTRFNENLRSLEFYNGSEWKAVNSYIDIGTSGRGVWAGGSTNVGPVAPVHEPSNIMNYTQLMTLGNTQYFGDLASGKFGVGGCASKTRGVFSAGGTPGITNSIEYVTIESQGNAIDFGDCVNWPGSGTVAVLGSFSSSTRGLVAGAGKGTTDTINYFEIATTGNAVDFGNLPSARGGGDGTCSPTRGYWIGGQTGAPSFTAQIATVLIASTGDATDFGDFSTKLVGCGAGGNQTRGLAGGGYQAPAPGAKVIDWWTYASTGKVTHFGDLSVRRSYCSGASTSTRVVFGSGESPSAYINVMDYVMIASGGDAVDFGDYWYTIGMTGATSNSHGGLGGF